MLTAFNCKAEVDKPIREPAPPVAIESIARSPGDELPAEPQTSTRFSIQPPKTEVWAVLTGKCVPLGFQPSSSSEGYVLIAGRRVEYEIDEQTLALHDFSEHKENGLVHRACRTRVQLGEDGRFGQAELFADEPACAAKLASAVPLDDSRELIVSKCDGVKLAVDTDEVVCGASGRHSFTGKLGCFSVIAADLA
jgi:hypothetical protein